ncbi:MAG: hypothetical protein SCABRO_03531 [Candidatus Scalindua brodae]|uniref:Uncharacterized protein n=1 Tax=Candidatus Scalindua brodae TaxID=237368 RepID=A0A0B0EI05_9BACT|nr:MAG: hypothetical protein SCABRO_03531 [Candidatus Scalindua brodae]
MVAYAMVFLASESCLLMWVVANAETRQMAIAMTMAFAGCQNVHTSGQYVKNDHSLGQA